MAALGIFRSELLAGTALRPSRAVVATEASAELVGDSELQPYSWPSAAEGLGGLVEAYPWHRLAVLAGPWVLQDSDCSSSSAALVGLVELAAFFGSRGISEEFAVADRGAYPQSWP